jgi:hypothetical protein
MSESQLPPPFDEIYQKFITIQNAFKSGLIDAHTLQSELEKLEFEDQNEDSWRLSKDGQWYWHNGIEWIRREPISSLAVPDGIYQTAPESLQPAVKTKRKVSWPLIVIPIVVIILCAGVMAVLYVTGVFDPFTKSINNDSQLTSQEDTPDANLTPGVQEDSATAQPTIVPLTAITLSEDQQLILDDFGWPDAFMIMEMDDAEGNPQRVETWSYYEYQTSLTFSEGVFMYDEVEAQLSGEIFPTELRPNEFPLGISMDQLDELLPDVPLVPIENIDYFLEGLDIFLGESFVLGFYENRLFLIDTWAGLPEGAEP